MKGCVSVGRYAVKARMPMPTSTGRWFDLMNRTIDSRQLTKIAEILYSEVVFEQRSHEPERIDTGDYTEEEYKTFLREIRFINRWIGDRWALQKTLLKKIDE